MLPISLIAHFAWLVIVWSMLLAPKASGSDRIVIVDGDPRDFVVQAEGIREVIRAQSPDLPMPALPPIPLEPVSEPVPLEAIPVQESRPQAVNEPGVVSTPAIAPPCYWFVSSRQSAQHPREWNGCPLDVMQRNHDGSLTRSSIPALSSQLIPGVPVLVCIHGSFVTIEDNLKESAEAFNSIRSAAPHLPLQVIFFTWPSDGPYTLLAPIDVGIRGCRADFNGFHVAWLLSQISDDHPICLFGHSHGNRTVMATVQLLAGGTVDDYHFTGYRSNGKRIRIVMAAAAFDHNWLNPGKRYDRVPGRVEGILNLQNRLDLPLAFYTLSRPFAHRPIARIGTTSRDRYKLGANARKIVDCDVTHLVGHKHFWPEYYSNPAIISTTLPYLYFASRS